jgi:hypothetical protein
VKGFDPVVREGDQDLALSPRSGSARAVRDWLGFAGRAKPRDHAADMFGNSSWMTVETAQDLAGKRPQPEVGCAGSGRCRLDEYTGGVNALAGNKPTCQVIVRRDCNPVEASQPRHKALGGLGSNSLPLETAKFKKLLVQLNFRWTLKKKPGL